MYLDHQFPEKHLCQCFRILPGNTWAKHWWTQDTSPGSCYITVESAASLEATSSSVHNNGLYPEKSGNTTRQTAPTTVQSDRSKEAESQTWPHQACSRELRNWTEYDTVVNKRKEGESHQIDTTCNACQDACRAPAGPRI